VELCLHSLNMPLRRDAQLKEEEEEEEEAQGSNQEE
jgi:hypothetical protein